MLLLLYWSPTYIIYILYTTILVVFMAATASAAADRWQEGGGDQINQIIAGAELIRGV